MWEVSLSIRNSNAQCADWHRWGWHGAALKKSLYIFGFCYEFEMEVCIDWLLEMADLVWNLPIVVISYVVFYYIYSS